MSRNIYKADLHTHTVASGHATGTIEEMADAAKNAGLEIYGITDHAVTMPGTCSMEYFEDMVENKKQFEGIDVLYGVELNIIDYDGTVDMDNSILKKMDVVIASIHAGIGYEPGYIDENTAAVIGAIRNPYINIIGHPDDGNIPLNYSAVIEEAINNNTIIEINNNSLTSGCWRGNTRENIRRILELCKKNDYPVLIDSDAHCVENVGRHVESVRFLKENEFPRELILNYYPERLKKFLNKYK